MGEEIKTLAKGLSFLEGPRWRDGALYASDFYNNRVLRFAPDGTFTVACSVPGQPSGLGFTEDGDLIIVSMQDRRLVTSRGGGLVHYADLGAVTESLCNDMMVDRQGRAYVGNFGWDGHPDTMTRPTKLALVRPGGKVEIAAEDLVFPNGIVLTPDGRTLLVAETFAARISAFDVAPDGTLSNRRFWADFGQGPFPSIQAAVDSGAPLPDGMAMDAERCVWIGDAAGHGPLRVAEGGEILDSRNCGELAAYAVALGGDDLRDLYICASPPLLQSDPSTDHRAALLVGRTEVPGTPTF